MNYLDIDAPIEAEDTSQHVSRHDSSWSSEFPEASQVPMPLSEMANVLNDARDANGDALSRVVQSAIAILNDGERRDRIELLSETLNVKMLSSLLDQRRSIRSLANTEIPIEEEGHIVVTWVDALIAALSHSISTLLEEFDSVPSQDSIRPLRHDDQIRAVCLLPNAWDQIPHVLSSDRTTKACRRTALTLLFGIYVVAPKFTKLCVADVLPCTIAQKLQDRIQAYADERFEYRDAEQTDLQPLMYATASERKDDAMALSLYAVADRVLNSQTQPSAIFRPRTLSNFIVLIMTIMQDPSAPGSSGIPFLNIDGPQATLLLWGGFASWAWQTWTPGAPHYSVIVKMTATWFHNMALREKSCTRDAAHQTAANILEGRFPQDPTIAFVMMHEILSMVHNILTSFPSADQQVLCDTFELLCRGVAGVLRREGTQTSLSPQLIQDTRRLVCNVTLALVEQGGYFVEDSIITFLAEVHTHRLRFSFDSQDEVNVALEDFMRIVARLIKPLSQGGQQRTPELLPANRAFQLKLLIDILVLLLADTDEMAPRARIAMATPDLFKLFRTLQGVDIDCAALVTSLMASSLLLLCEILDTGVPQTKPLIPQDVGKSAQGIIFQEGSKSFVMTMAAIQLFTRAKIGDCRSGIDHVVQFNFLRDALLLNFPSASGAELFYTLAPSLCWSLHWELSTMQPSIRGSQHVLRSPWTTSLLAQLDDLRVYASNGGPSILPGVQEQLLAAIDAMSIKIQAMRRNDTAPPSAPRQPARRNLAGRHVSLTYTRLSPEDRYQNLLAIYQIEHLVP